MCYVCFRSTLGLVFCGLSPVTVAAVIISLPHKIDSVNRNLNRQEKENVLTKTKNIKETLK